MTATALRQGQRRYQQQRRREAVQRVKAYRAWLKAGSDLRSIPPIPSSHDFRIAREGRR